MLRGSVLVGSRRPPCRYSLFTNSVLVTALGPQEGVLQYRVVSFWENKRTHRVCVGEPRTAEISPCLGGRDVVSILRVSAHTARLNGERQWPTTFKVVEKCWK